MNKRLRRAIEAVIREAEGCSLNEQGQLQCMDSTVVALLIVEYDQECKKQGYPRVRANTASSTRTTGTATD